MTVKTELTQIARAPCDLVLSSIASLLNYRSERLTATYNPDTLEFHVDATKWNSGGETPAPRQTGKIEGLLIVMPWALLAMGYGLVSIVLPEFLGATGLLSSAFIGFYIVVAASVWYRSSDEFEVVPHEASIIADGREA